MKNTVQVQHNFLAGRASINGSLRYRKIDCMIKGLKAKQARINNNATKVKYKKNEKRVARCSYSTINPILIKVTIQF